MSKARIPSTALFLAAGLCVGLGSTGTLSTLVNEAAPSVEYLAPNVDNTSDLPQLQSSEGKVRLLYRDYVDVYGSNYTTRNQGNAPSCVGQATAGAIDFLAAIQVKNGQLPRPPPGRASASWIYGSSRETGGMNDSLFGGSFVSYAVESLNQSGFPYEENFDLLGIDITGDNAKRDVEYGRTLPDELRPFCYNYVDNYYKLESYEEVRDAIGAGMPVIVGSNVGFGNPVCGRDSQGFLYQPRFKFKGRNWYHALFFIGVADVDRKGVLCQNSWGADWVSGAKRFGDEPSGSFWIDASTIDRMAAQGDCYAINNLTRAN